MARGNWRLAAAMVVILGTCLQFTYGVELTFELPDNAKECFYEDIEKGTESSLEFQVCFSNEFSTFSHKLIYVDFQVGDEPQLPGVGDHYTAMTQMESSSQKIHENLNSILDYQTHHRLREAQGRKRAEDLNERVLFWAMGETLGILVIAVGQVMILKNFFADKKSNQASY